MQILVTGATGALGRAVIETLLTRVPASSIATLTPTQLQKSELNFSGFFYACADLIFMQSSFLALIGTIGAFLGARDALSGETVYVAVACDWILLSAHH